MEYARKNALKEATNICSNSEHRLPSNNRFLLETGLSGANNVERAFLETCQEHRKTNDSNVSQPFCRSSRQHWHLPGDDYPRMEAFEVFLVLHNSILLQKEKNGRSESLQPKAIQFAETLEEKYHLLIFQDHLMLEKIENYLIENRKHTNLIYSKRAC